MKTIKLGNMKTMHRSFSNLNFIYTVALDIYIPVGDFSV